MTSLASSGEDSVLQALVTGGAGFIGSHLVRALLGAGWRVRVLDNLETGDRAHVPREAQFIEADVTDASVVSESATECAIIFHLAAFTSVPGSFAHPERCFAVNITGTLHIIRAALQAGVRRVVFASSSAVYSDQAGPLAETSLPTPGSPYAMTKLSGEHLLGMYLPLGCWAALRFFNVFGPRQAPDGEYAAVIPQFLLQALRGEDLVIFGDGDQSRDFVYVSDVVRACVRVAEQGSGVYNVGTGQAVTIRHLAELVRAVAGRPAVIRFAPRRPGDVAHSRADVRRLQTELGWSPEVDFRQGLEHTLGWLSSMTNS